MIRRNNRFVLLLTGLALFWTVSQHQRGSQLFQVIQSPNEENKDRNVTVTPLCSPRDNYDQLDPCLISLVKSNYLVSPSPNRTEKKVAPPFFRKSKAIKEKMAFIRKHLIEKNPKPGFFIEYGTHDGSFISPTLPLEQEHNWTGLVIEADPVRFKDLLGMRRNAWAINVALCNDTHSKQVSVSRGGDGSMAELLDLSENINVTCVPLYSILAALNVSTVDYLGLDGEGADLDILRTVPFDKIVFKVITAEHAQVAGFQMGLMEFMGSKGYVFIGSLLDHFTQDSLFVHPSIYTSDMALTREPSQVSRAPGIETTCIL